MKKAVLCSLAYVLIWAGLSLAQTVNTPSTAPAANSTASPFYVSAEALLWWMKDGPAPPPLVSTGIIGEAGTEVVLGGKSLDTDMHPGFRVTVGYWEKERWGVEAGFFYLTSQSTGRSVSSSGQADSQLFAVPFYNVLRHEEDFSFLSLPGVFSGQAHEEMSSRMFGAELMGGTTLVSTGACKVDFLGGFRYLNLREKFSFATSSPFIDVPNDIYQTLDQFNTANHFYGVQAGLRASSGWGPLTVKGTFKLGLGAVVQTVDIDGYLLTNEFNALGSALKYPGGYFALPTNIGEHTQTDLAVIPEIGLNLGYKITDRINVFAGYTFLYANNVVRPGDQIDRGINPSQGSTFTGIPAPELTGVARPAFSFQQSEFWAQGVNMGVEYRF